MGNGVCILDGGIVAAKERLKTVSEQDILEFYNG